MDLKTGGASTASLYAHSRAGTVYAAYATGVTALPAYTATALGPLLWNGSTQNPQLKAVLIGLTIAVTTASTAAVSIGIVGGNLQPGTPGSTTAITKVGSTYLSGKQPTCTAYKAATISVAGNVYQPLFTLDTEALTANPAGPTYLPLDGLFVVPQGSWIAVAAGATASTSVLDIGLVWAEVTV